jgi:hypothetical protein
MRAKQKIVVLWHATLQVLAIAAHALRVYPTWAKVYRWLRQRKFKTVKVPQNLSLIEAQKQMNKLKWRKDTWREAWDSVGAPQWVQHCLNQLEMGNGQPDGALDCDDFAAWGCRVIAPEFAPYFFGQGWAPIEDGHIGFKTTGHAVCVVQDTETNKLWHCGNWGLVGPFDTLRDVGINISGHHVNRGKPITWCLYKDDMRLVAMGNGLPPQTVPELM